MLELVGVKVGDIIFSLQKHLGSAYHGQSIGGSKALHCIELEHLTYSKTTSFLERNDRYKTSAHFLGFRRGASKRDHASPQSGLRRTGASNRPGILECAFNLLFNVVYVGVVVHRRSLLDSSATSLSSVFGVSPSPLIKYVSS